MFSCCRLPPFPQPEPLSATRTPQSRLNGWEALWKTVAVLLPSSAPTSVSKAQHSDVYIEFWTSIFFFLNMTMAASAIVPHIKCRPFEPRALFKTFPRIWQSASNTQNTLRHCIWMVIWNVPPRLSWRCAACVTSIVMLVCDVSLRWWTARWTSSRQLIRWWADCAPAWWRSASTWRSRAPTLVSVAEMFNGVSRDTLSGERKLNGLTHQITHGGE